MCLKCRWEWAGRPVLWSPRRRRPAWGQRARCRPIRPNSARFPNSWIIFPCCRLFRCPPARPFRSLTPRSPGNSIGRIRPRRIQIHLAYGTNALTGNTTNANAAYTQGFGPGTELNVGFDNARYTTNSLQSAFSPYTTSSLGFTVTQPLLRGFGLAVNRRFIRISKNEQKIAGLLVQQQLIATVYGVVRLYTDLVALYEDVKVKEETLASAEKLFTDTKSEVDEGTQAPVELTRANAQVFSIRQDLIDSRGLLEEQEAIVKNVITRRTDNDPEVLNARIIPTDSIEVPGTDETRPLQDLIAFRLSPIGPIYRRPACKLENTQISLKGSRNGLRPEVDLVGTAQNSALAGSTESAWRRPSNRLCLGGYGNALEQLATRKYPTYGIGLNHYFAAAQSDRPGRRHARRDPAAPEPGAAAAAPQAGAAGSGRRADRDAARPGVV